MDWGFDAVYLTLSHSRTASVKPTAVSVTDSGLREREAKLNIKMPTVRQSPG